MQKLVFCDQTTTSRNIREMLTYLWKKLLLYFINWKCIKIFNILKAFIKGFYKTGYPKKKKQVVTLILNPYLCFLTYHCRVKSILDNFQYCRRRMFGISISKWNIMFISFTSYLLHITPRPINLFIENGDESLRYHWNTINIISPFADLKFKPTYTQCMWMSRAKPHN